MGSHQILYDFLVNKIKISQKLLGVKKKLKLYYFREKSVLLEYYTVNSGITDSFCLNCL